MTNIAFRLVSAYLYFVSTSPNKILFYDGDCGFCNRSVAFVLKSEKEKEISFTSLQSNFAQEFFKNKGWSSPDLTTIYYFVNGKLFSKSRALLQISKEIKYPYRLLRLFLIVPNFIRDRVYDLIARRRHLLNADYCLIVEDIDKNRFLS